MADQDNDKIQISIAQVAASSLAAVSAAVICSFFGVAGTIIGTAVASIFATVGSALYAHSLRRTKARLRQLHQAGGAATPITEVFKTTRQQWRDWFGEVPWRKFGLGAAGAFLAAIAVLTLIEVGIGEPLAALFGVSHDGSRSTTVGSLTGTGSHQKKHKSHPKPSSTATGTASPTASSASPKASHSATTSPSTSATPSPTGTATKTPSPTPTPTDTATVSPSP